MTMHDSRPRRRGSGTLHWLPLILGDARLDGTDVLLLVGLADHVGDDGTCWVSVKRLAAYARCSYGTARRRLASLEERGYIARTPNHRPDGGRSVDTFRLNDDAFDDATADHPPAQNEQGPPAQNERGPRAPRRAGPPAHPGARAEVPKKEQPLEGPAADAAAAPLPGIDPPKAEDPAKAQARAITNAVWDRRNPKPATPWIAAAKIAERLILAGHSPAAIEAAMVEAPTISTGAVEFALNRAAQRKPANAARVDQDRRAPSGRIAL